MTKSAGFSHILLEWMLRALVATVWVSAFLFGVYILAFYAFALLDGDLTQWNDVLPDLYEVGEPMATAGIGLHFAAGGLILILGSIQLINAVRDRFPKVHRWLGRVYVVASIFTAVGGLTFIVVSGTVGGTVMNIGFTLYGILTLLCAIQTIRHARSGRFKTHQHWSWRLYALAIGSWLYRIEYGFWFLFTGRLGHNDTFTGWFDHIMSFWFFIPNLLVVEWMIRNQNKSLATNWRWISSLFCVVATAFLLLGTYFFSKMLWLPIIIDTVQEIVPF